MGKITGLLAGKPIQLVKHDDILVRKDFGPDVSVVKEWGPTYKRMQHEIAGHKILDIGANIGLFTVRAMALGAKGAICYEPEPGAFSVLSANAAGLKNVKVRNMAVEKVDGNVTLYVPSSGNAVCATTSRVVRGRDEVKVKAKAFESAIENCTLIKTDCEGSELLFLDGRKLPSSVKVVCGELHRSLGRAEASDKVIRSFSKWREIHPPASYSYARCWTVAWIRK